MTVLGRSATLPPGGRRHRAALAGLAAAMLLAAAPGAQAGKADCRGVDSVARIGFPDGIPLSIESGVRDRQTGGRYCAFSMAGVAASSPPEQAVADALDILRVDRLRERGFDSDLIDALAWTLVAAGTEEAPSDEMRAALLGSGDILRVCLDAFAFGDDIATTETLRTEAGSFLVSCAVDLVGGDGKEIVGFTLARPRLVVTLWDFGTETLRMALLPRRFGG